MRTTIAVVILASAPQPARAQLFLDSFIGRSAPESREASITTDGIRVDAEIVSVAARIEIERVKPAAAVTYGARLGYWRGPFGIAVDLSTLDLDLRRQTIRATGKVRFDEEVFGERIVIDPGESVEVGIPRTSIPTTATAAALILVRMPHGKLQPYAFTGPVYVVTDSDLSGSWGLRVGAGLRASLTRHLSLFGEVRHTRVDATSTAGHLRGRADGRDVRLPVNVDFHLRQTAVVAGIGLTF